MKRQLTTSLFLLTTAAAAATGCAADISGSGDDDYTEPTPPQDPQPVPLTPEGTFAIHSKFDVATNMPGRAGEVVNYFISATDDPDDPTKFIVEQIVDALPDGSVKTNLAGAIPFVAGYLNDRLLEVAPDFVLQLVDIGDALGEITRNFGTMDTLQIAANGRAVKTVDGVKFKVDGVDLEFPFVDVGLTPIRVDGLQVTLEPTGKMTISNHKLPLKYGQLLKLALEQAVLPMIDPSVSTLGEYLETLVDCRAVGQYVFEALDFGAASTYEQACLGGLNGVASVLYRKLDGIDTAALEFSLTGTARGVDKNRDGKMDDIVTGVWTGELAYAGTPAPLASATFNGRRL